VSGRARLAVGVLSLLDLLLVGCSAPFTAGEDVLSLEAGGDAAVVPVDDPAPADAATDVAVTDPSTDGSSETIPDDAAADAADSSIADTSGKGHDGAIADAGQPYVAVDGGVGACQ
jgi:hypothetical protein